MGASKTAPLSAPHGARHAGDRLTLRQELAKGLKGYGKHQLKK